MSAQYAGLGVGSGRAAGPVVRATAPPPPPAGRRTGDPRPVTAEAVAALDAVADELDELARRVGAGGATLAAQARIARDPGLAGAVTQLARSGRTAARAVYEAVAAYREARAADPLRPAPPAADLDDLRDRAVARLLGHPAPGIVDPGTPYVLVARDLAPALTAGLDPRRVLALVTEQGGPTSHTAVLAKSLGIPAVVACPGAAALVDGQRVVVDGPGGTVTADPAAALVADVRRRRRAPQPAAGEGPGRLADGHPVALHAAVGGPADLAAAAAGAEGVGVFRTEFAFLGRTEAPTVAEQVAAYRRVFDAFPGRPVTVRTLDVGADKPLEFLPLGEQLNPALGIRGVRVGRRDPQLLADQLAAIARAAQGSGAQVRVMAPMVATVEEAAFFAGQARARGLDDVGVMVEVPAAALRAADLLDVVDFVSVGTNDLAQYALAADRTCGELADLLDPWQPGLLTLVAAVAGAATAAGRPAMVCGEAAGDPLLAPVLVGLGAAGLSMTPRALPAVRAALAAVTSEQCAAAAAGALAAASGAQARAAAGAALACQG